MGERRRYQYGGLLRPVWLSEVLDVYLERVEAREAAAAAGLATVSVRALVVGVAPGEVVGFRLSWGQRPRDPAAGEEAPRRGVLRAGRVGDDGAVELGSVPVPGTESGNGALSHGGKSGPGESPPPPPFFGQPVASSLGASRAKAGSAPEE